MGAPAHAQDHPHAPCWHPCHHDRRSMSSTDAPDRGPRGTGLRYAAVVALTAMIAMNALANALPLGGRTTAEISDSFDLVFVPAGYVFAIWGVIYALLVAHVLYSVTSAGGRSDRVAAAAPWLPLNFVANGAWIAAWHYGLYLLSLALMLVILATLIVVSRRLERLDDLHPSAGPDLWLVRVPVSVYLGWISVATIANVAVVLLDLGWSGAPLSPEAWTVILIAMATGLNLRYVAARRDLAFGAVGVWALIGIGAKQMAPYPVVGVAAYLGAVAILAAAAWTTLVRPLSRGPAAG